jgi:hypothetical protein
VSSLLTLVFEAVSVACILSLAFVVLFKHGLVIDNTIVKAQGMTFHGLSLAVVICVFSLVGFESATTLGSEEPAEERPASGCPQRDPQPLTAICRFRSLVCPALARARACARVGANTRDGRDDKTITQREAFGSRAVPASPVSFRLCERDVQLDSSTARYPALNVAPGYPA